MNNYSTDTPIYALATPLAPSALAVIRTSGQDSISLLANAFSRSKALLKAQTNTMVYGSILAQDGTTIDEVQLCVYHKGHGYTAEEAVEIMEESLETVYTCMVTYAVRDSAIGDKTIKKGDILGMADKDITVICSDINECAKELIANSVKADKDVITIYYGEEITEEKAEEVLAFAKSKFPNMEVELEYGGQPLYYYIISVE